MAWKDITGTTYTGWRIYEEVLTLSSATSINTSALINYKGNTVLSAVIKESSANLTVATTTHATERGSETVKVQISIDGTHWVDMQTGITPGVTAAKTGCGMMIDLRNIIAPYYRIVITCTSYTGDVKIQYAVKE